MSTSIFQKTELGRQALKERSAGLTSKQRSAFILFDGVRTSLEVLTATSGLGMTQDDIDLMVHRGYLTLVTRANTTMSPAGGLKTGNSRPSPLSVLPSIDLTEAASGSSSSQLYPSGLTDTQERYRLAYPIAVSLTSSLGLRGFRLNLSVEAAGSYEQLLALLPKIKEAVGAEKCRKLSHLLEY